MIRGLYTAASSMLCETIRQDMVANNLANVDTPGFKRDQGIFKELPTMEIRKVNDGQLYPPRPFYKYPKIGKLGTGVILDETYTDFKAGKFEYTGNNLDLALANNKAFFVYESKNGIRYSRDGVLTVNQDGYLTDMNGDYLLGEKLPANEIKDETLVSNTGKKIGTFGRIKVGKREKLTVGEDGIVTVDGNEIARILRAKASDRKAFRKEGSNLYKRAYGNVTRAMGDVKPGYVEKPNFSIVEAMVKMIEVSRAYEANSKVIQSQDGLLDKAINSVGVSRR